MSSIHFAMVWKNIKIQGDTDSTHQLYSIQRQMITGAPSQLSINSIEKSPGILAAS